MVRRVAARGDVVPRRRTTPAMHDHAHQVVRGGGGATTGQIDGLVAVDLGEELGGRAVERSLVPFQDDEEAVGAITEFRPLRDGAYAAAALKRLFVPALVIVDALLLEVPLEPFADGRGGRANAQVESAVSLGNACTEDPSAAGRRTPSQRPCIETEGLCGRVLAEHGVEEEQEELVRVLLPTRAVEEPGGV